MIETDRLYLKHITKEDSDKVFEILSKNEVIDNLNLDKPKKVEDVQKLIEEYLEGYKNNTKEPFKIIDKKDGNFIGVFILKLDLYSEDAYEMTVYLHPNYWNKKINTECIKNIIPYFFANYPNNNLKGYIMEKNKASIKVLENLNFTLEKVFKVEGIEDNIYSYIITRDECE